MLWTSCHKYAHQSFPEAAVQNCQLLTFVPTEPASRQYKKNQYTYLFDQWPKRLRKRQPNTLKCNLGSLASPRQRTHIVRLRCRDPMAHLLRPRCARCLSLRDPHVSKPGVKPDTVPVAVQFRPIILRWRVSLRNLHGVEDLHPRPCRISARRHCGRLGRGGLGKGLCIELSCLLGCSVLGFCA